MNITCDDFRLLNSLQKHLVLFLTSDKLRCNPPSHSLECNKVFIICQAYYKKDYKKKSDGGNMKGKPPSDLINQLTG